MAEIKMTSKFNDKFIYSNDSLIQLIYLVHTNSLKILFCYEIKQFTERIELRVYPLQPFAISSNKTPLLYISSVQESYFAVQRRVACEKTTFRILSFSFTHLCLGTHSRENILRFPLTVKKTFVSLQLSLSLNDTLSKFITNFNLSILFVRSFILLKRKCLVILWWHQNYKN